MDNKNLTEDLNGNEIAIIGMSGRFPGASDIQTFWQNLVDGTCSVSFFTDEELLEAGISPEVLNDPSYVKAGGTLEGTELFDANFFSYSPREAEIIDPQQRLFLECAWTALEDAGYTPDTFAGLIGVYAGVAKNTYLLNNLYNNPAVLEAIDGFHLLLANDKDHLATRTAYKLNLRGPSLTVQTACSTSLVAVHLGCQSLLNGECDMVLAGGVAAKAPVKQGYFYQKGGIFSPDGFCRTFDAQSQGTIETSGLGIVVLKRLDDAIDSHDHVYAVIKGSAINNDGSVKMGYTAPSVQGQVAVIREALSLANIAPDDISYIEAHGTGTPLGDPIEISALQRVFAASTDKKGFCAIGSVKTNIGHMDTAAGVAGLIKTTLMLKNSYIPASLHFSQPNPAIDFANSPFYVNTSAQAWPKKSSPKRAGVSSFGIGGTNCHVVLQESPTRAPSEKDNHDYHLLVLSAKTSSALEVAREQLATYLENNPTLSLPDVAYTLQAGRSAFNYRYILTCRDLPDAIHHLRSTDDFARHFLSKGEPGKHPLVFLFPGQGTQFVEMGRELYAQEEVFRAEVDQCCEILQPLLGLDLRSVLYPHTVSAEATEQINQTVLAQPALFVIEYALARLWMNWGIQPAAFIGHSIGEYVAACLSGVFSLRDALSIVAARGRIVQQLPSGGMLAISGSPEEFDLPAGLSLAAINGPKRCVVSGPLEDISALKNVLTEKKVKCRLLHTSHAFHSAMLDAVLPAFAAQVQHIKLSSPQIPYLSNVTGTWITAEEASDPLYWVRQLRQTVLFAPALNELKARPEWILLEVGPGRTLSTLARQSLPNHLIFSSLPPANDPSNTMAFISTTLGRLWLNGMLVTWSNLYSQQRQRLSLPTYPFERERFWIEPASFGVRSDLSEQKKVDTKKAIKDWFYLPAWTQSIAPKSSSGSSAQTTTWLIFSDACGFAKELLGFLVERGHSVVLVQPGETFAHVAERSYTVRPQRLEDYDMLLTELLALELFPTKIIHAWSLRPSKQLAPADQLLEGMHYGYYGLLYLAQALVKQHAKTAIKLHLLTNNMQAIAGEGDLYPEKALISGLCKVIPQECTYISCQSIDIVVPHEDGWQKQQLFKQLCHELLHDSAEAVIAYRQNQRWVQSFARLKMADKPDPLRMLRQRGVYLLIGGLGDIGLLFAEYLAKTVQADLVLLGRSSFPAQSTWVEWLATHEGEDKISHKISRLQAIERSGSRIFIVQADVCDLPQMENMLTEVYSRFGQLHGVIYAAGASSAALVTPLDQVNIETSEQHFRPKVHGLLVLERVLEGKELDFCLLQSSLSSILGGFGFSAYAAANLFIDAYVQAHNRLSPVPWLTINWDGWQFNNATDEIGLLLNSAHITASEGMEAFSYLFTGNTNQIVVSALDLKARLEQWINPGSTTRLEERKNLTVTEHIRPQLQSEFVAPRNETEQRVVETWEGALGITQISVYDNFFELGGDSLLAIQLNSQLYAEFGVDIPLQSLLETPTVAGIAQIIQAKITTPSASIL